MSEKGITIASKENNDAICITQVDKLITELMKYYDAPRESFYLLVFGSGVIAVAEKGSTFLEQCQSVCIAEIDDTIMQFMGERGQPREAFYLMIIEDSNQIIVIENACL